MAGVWFSPDNEFGKIKAPLIHSSEPSGFSGNYKWYFYALLYVDSAAENLNIPLLTSVGGISATNLNRWLRIYINNGILSAEGGIDGLLSNRGYSAEKIPFDKFFEIYITANPSTSTYENILAMHIDGSQQVVNDIYGNRNRSCFGSYNQITLGGNETQLGHAKSLFLIDAILYNDSFYNIIPPEESTSSSYRLWRWRFEDSNNPFKIETSHNGVSVDLDTTNTDPATVIWTETNQIPDSGGGAGGIVIPRQRQ